MCYAAKVLQLNALCLAVVIGGLSAIRCSGSDSGSSPEADAGTADSNGTVDTGQPPTGDTVDVPTEDTNPVSTDPGGEWMRHVINDEVGESIMLQFVDDLCGDGTLKAVGANHTNTKDKPTAPESQVVMFDVPTDAAALKGPWPMNKISTGIESRKSPLLGPQGAPGIFGVGDVDDDGDIDLLVSGDGDAHIYVLEQTTPCVFETRILASGMGQAGAMLVVDLDNDNKMEMVVSSYEANVVQVYKWKSPATTDYGTYANNFNVFTIAGKEHTTPAFASTYDIDGDNQLEVLVSHYSPTSDFAMTGELVLYKRSGVGLDAWTATVVDKAVKFPHKSVVMNIDGDKDLDIFLPSGFLACEAIPGGSACGAIQWYEKTGSTWTKHSIIGPKNKLFYWQGVFDDYDHDGIVDFITVGERKPTSGKPTAEVQLFKGTTSDPFFSTTPITLIQGLGSLPVGADLDKDGDLDIFSAEYFLPTATFPKFSFAWLEQVATPKPGL